MPNKTTLTLALKCLLHLLIVLPSIALGQDFKLLNPLEIQPSLAGNFGELRPNHFHAGIDLKTGGQEGLKILASGDGFVSRIKISPYGYGKAVYIDHPGGYTTVYAHLKSLNDTLERYTKKYQYAQESFEVDIYPGKNDLPVKAGEMIALSGNTGGSSGPHLHFEVRETVSELARNPLLFEFPVSDSKKPVIEAIGIAPIGSESKVNGASSTFHVRNAISEIQATQPIEVRGRFGIEITGYDSQDGSPNKNGIYKIELRVDGNEVSTYISDSISFDLSRHINALVDFEYYYQSKTRFLRLYKLPGNKLENLQCKNNGILKLSAGMHEVSIIALDIAGNEQKVDFKVNVIPEIEAEIEKAEIKWNVPYIYESEDFMVYFPIGTVYENTVANITESQINGIPSISISKQAIPVQEAFTINMKSDKTKDAAGWLIAQFNKDGRPSRALNTSVDGDYFKAESKSFGVFSLYKDAAAPVITSVNFTNEKVWNSGHMKFTIKDNFSGISTYSAYVNDKWVLMEYEPKQETVSIDVNEITKSNDVQHLTLKVIDMAGNVATFEGRFFRK